ncbi:MAG: hypothetical protein QXE01_07065 [Sulfolobales archaeon]
MGSQAAYPFRYGRPIMLSGVVALMLGGLVGVGRMLSYQGVDLGVIVGLSSAFPIHWFLMIYGFLLSLISLEILALLSFEWSGGVASSIYRLLYLILFWISVFLLLLGNLEASLLTVSAILIIVSIYASRIYLKPSRLGFKPTHYNYLLTASPGVGGAVILAWLLARQISSISPYEVAIASLAFPVATIIAVESRDIPLLLGGSPLRPSTRRSMFIGYGFVVAGILIFSQNIYPWLRPLGGILLIIGAFIAIYGSGLLRSLLEGVRGGLVPRYMAIYSATHLVTAFSWLIIGGVLMILYQSMLGFSANPRDLVIHSIALGYIFNTIFGVDAVLMYSHMGISLRRAPKPSYIPYILLNTSLILRAIYDIYGFGGVTLLSAPLTGVSIVLFFAMHNIRLSRLRREMERVAGQGVRSSSREKQQSPL